MVALFGAVFAFAVLALLASASCASGATSGERARVRAGAAIARRRNADAAGLKYLDGGGDGCTYPDAQPSFARRRFHHLTFYGFLLCFAATIVATIYHYVFGWQAPYPFCSLPVILGTLGGLGLLVGPAGLLWLTQPPRSGARRSGARRAWTSASSCCCSSPASPGSRCSPSATPARWACCSRCTSGAVHGALPDAALRQVRARALPLRGAGAIPRRAPAPTGARVAE